MNKPENQHAQVLGRSKQARKTWLWTRMFFGLLFVALAAFIYFKSGRMVLALIFGVVGIIELVNVFLNPFKGSKK